MTRALLALLLIATPLAAQARHVVLVTIDGVRVEDMLQGIDPAMIASPKEAGIADTAAFRMSWWRDSATERRRAVMPFVWDTLVRDGVFYGSGPDVRVTNDLNFSGPGYTELFTGHARADVTSNADRRYTHPTIFQVVAGRPGNNFTDVAAFTSWTTQARLTATRPGEFVSQGPFGPLPDEFVDDSALVRMRVVQGRVHHPDRSLRYDAFTHEMALSWLRRFSPVLLHVGYGETDVEAHGRHYDRYIEMLHETDRMISELVHAVMADPEMARSTVFVITTDHGRGATPKDWTDHGKDVANAARWWLLASGPGVSIRGVVSDAATQQQVGPTVLKLLGLGTESLDAPVAAPLDLGSH